MTRGRTAIVSHVGQKSNPFRLQLSYHCDMKMPPKSPEFTRFTNAMGKILKVSKVELQKRLEEEKRKPKAPASRVPDASS